MALTNHMPVLTQSHRRLLAFVLGLIVFAGLLELGVRRNGLLFSAASHRALAKVAMFERHSRVDILFLGTSRTQDGVSPALIAEAVTKFAPAIMRPSQARVSMPSKRSLAASCPSQN